MNFRRFIQNSRLEEIVKKHFPTAILNDYRTTLVWLAELSTGQRVTLSVYENKPKSVQIGFTIDRSKRAELGAVSPKDPASNQHLMPGSLGLMRAIKALSAELKENGFLPWYSPIDDRRSRFYKKLIG